MTGLYKLKFRNVESLRKTTNVVGMVVKSWAYIIGQNIWLCNLL